VRENAAELTCLLKLDGHCTGARLRRNIKAQVVMGSRHQGAELADGSKQQGRITTQAGISSKYLSATTLLI